MSERAARAERQCAMLGELAELGLSLARDLQQRALAAEAAEEAAGLADAFHRVSRSVRQSLALEARLARDAERLAEEDAVAAQRARRAAVARREAVLSEAVERIIWTECEKDEGERLSDRLAMLVEDEMSRPGFTEDDVQAQVRRICRALGLPEAKISELPLAAICREAEDEVDAVARLAEAERASPPGVRAAGGFSGEPWRSSA